MRVLLCVALVLVACKGKEHAREAPRAPAGSGSAAAAPVLDGWKRIEALATPTVDPGPSKDLERAIAIAQANKDTWREARFKYPSTPLAEYTGGADALEALHAWSTANGGLPAPGKPTEVGLVTMGIHDVGSMAVSTATDLNGAALADATVLASRLLREGRNFLEVQIGISMFDAMKRKVRTLVADSPGISDSQVVPPDMDLVRILAAEALTSRRSIDYASSPEGRKDFIERAKQLAPETSNLLKGVTGKTALGLIPTDEESAALMQFWLAALDGAQRGEPAATTVARVRKAAETAPGPAKENGARIASVLDMLKSSYERLSEPSPF